MLDSRPVTVGSLVESIRYGFRGTVVYVGTTQFSHGLWVGLTLDDASGMTNRTLRGKHFLTCNGKPGMFVRHSWIKPVREGADTTAQRLQRLPRREIVDMFKFQTMWITVGQLLIKLANEEMDSSPATAKLPKREIVETPSTPAQTPLATPVIPTLFSLAAKKVAREAMVAKEQCMVEMEKAQLERERAEERANSLQAEAESLRVKVDTLTMNLDILTCEIEEKRCHIKQLEEQYGRLEGCLGTVVHDLVELRNLALEETGALRQTLRDLEALEEVNKLQGNSRETELREKLEDQETIINELKKSLQIKEEEIEEKRLDGAASSCHIKQLEEQNGRLEGDLIKMSNLRNVALEEAWDVMHMNLHHMNNISMCQEIDRKAELELRETIRDLEALKEVNKLQGNARETELREELEDQETIINELKKSLQIKEEEIEEKRSDGAASSCHIKQLEEQNGRLEVDLVEMSYQRNLDLEDTWYLRQTISDMMNMMNKTSMLQEIDRKKELELRETIRGMRNMSKDQMNLTSMCQEIHRKAALELREELEDQKTIINELHYLLRITEEKLLVLEKPYRIMRHTDAQTQTQSQKEAREAMVAKEQYMVEMEKARLERERAEERANSLQEEADSLRMKVDKLTMNLDILTCEIEEKRLDGAASSCHIKQLEEQNGRLEGDLIKMSNLRNVALEEAWDVMHMNLHHMNNISMCQEIDRKVELELRETIRDLEALKEVNKLQGNAREKELREKLEDQETIINELKKSLQIKEEEIEEKRLDGASSSFHIKQLEEQNGRLEVDLVEMCNLRNVALEETGVLRETIRDLEALKEVNKLQGNARETELREKLEDHVTIINELKKSLQIKEEEIEEKRSHAAASSCHIKQLEEQNGRIEADLVEMSNLDLEDFWYLRETISDMINMMNKTSMLQEIDRKTELELRETIRGMRNMNKDKMNLTSMCQEIDMKAELELREELVDRKTIIMRPTNAKTLTRSQSQ